MYWSSQGFFEFIAPRAPVSKIDLDNMIGESMKEIDSDEDSSGDDIDPDLLVSHLN